MIELEDVGRDVLLTFCSWSHNYYQTEVRVQMVIKAPRGTMALFDNKYISPDSQCEAIRAFMEEHNND